MYDLDVGFGYAYLRVGMSRKGVLRPKEIIGYERKKTKKRSRHHESRTNVDKREETAQCQSLG